MISRVVNRINNENKPINIGSPPKSALVLEVTLIVMLTRNLLEFLCFIGVQFFILSNIANFLGDPKYEDSKIFVMELDPPTSKYLNVCSLMPVAM